MTARGLLGRADLLAKAKSVTKERMQRWIWQPTAQPAGEDRPSRCRQHCRFRRETDGLPQRM